MNPEDWRALAMLPPSPSHNPFHEYVNIGGGLSDKGKALLKFSLAMQLYSSQLQAEVDANG